MSLLGVATPLHPYSLREQGIHDGAAAGKSRVYTRPLNTPQLHCSLRPLNSWQEPPLQPHHFPFKPFFLTPKFLTNLALSLLSFSALLSSFTLLSLLPPDFSHRWYHLVTLRLDEEEEQQANTSSLDANSASIFSFPVFFSARNSLSNGVVRRRRRRAQGSVTASDLPSHLWQAVVASEDRRFFQHPGVDPVSISRAVLSFSAAGGGSTITQQLVKNVFLSNERKWERKVVEAVLALILESKISKWKILWSYMSKIYWGHGTYGIKAAAYFYFGKHPSLLSLGESAMLAGIIPAPELLSPLRDLSRGKKPQARALRRMVEAGFLDIDTALWVVNQPLYFRVDGQDHAFGLRHNSYLARKGLSVDPKNKRSIKGEIWDWEKESTRWEVIEHMEKWAAKQRNRTALISSSGSRLKVFYWRNW